VIFSLGRRYISAPVSADGGTARISVGDLRNLTNETQPLPMQANYPYVPPLYFGGFIGFVVYSHTEQTVGGKKFGFVKEKVVLGNVTFEHSI
jgi:hypothetical protein